MKKNNDVKIVKETEKNRDGLDYIFAEQTMKNSLVFLLPND